MCAGNPTGITLSVNSSVRGFLLEQPLDEKVGNIRTQYQYKTGMSAISRNMTGRKDSNALTENNYAYYSM